ncbi:hypothetical protein HKW90_01585 [Pseudomonas aeruginosa]|nr:hypothetical protein [Pseudomonas aeruginosa]
MTHVLKANLKSKLTHFADSVVLTVAGAIWKLVKVFDPRPIQEHFAARPPVNGVMFTNVFSLPDADVGQSIVRLGWQHIQSENKPSGIVGRKKLVKVFNPANGHFVILYAMGANQGRPLKKDSVALDYDAKLALGISKEENVDLIVGEANLGDREYFHMYTDHDASSRSARALGWYLFMAGIGWSIAATVEGLVTAVLNMF